MIEPIYNEEGITLFNARAQDVLPQFRDGEFDLVLTDAPYGVGMGYDIFEDTRDNLKQLIAETFPDIRRVGKRVLITPGIINLTLYPESDWILAWTYRTTNSTGRWGFTMWQPILAYGKDPYLANGMGRRPDVIECTEALDLSARHPCPKPIKTWNRILERASVRREDWVLDPFAGSGTTLLAAKQSGRKAVGIELSGDYCRLIIDRLSQTQMVFD